jgi:hypothetical protein
MHHKDNTTNLIEYRSPQTIKPGDCTYNTYHYQAGWLRVAREVVIEFDLETTPLEIKTNSTLKSGQEVDVWFSTSQGHPAAGICFTLTSPPQYFLYDCRSRTDFPTILPSAIDRVWRVTLTRTAGIRLKVHCNEVEVLNILISHSTCSDSMWSDYWSREIAEIFFTSWDDASDFYRPMRGN